MGKMGVSSEKKKMHKEPKDGTAGEMRALVKAGQQLKDKGKKSNKRKPQKENSAEPEDAPKQKKQFTKGKKFQRGKKGKKPPPPLTAKEAKKKRQMARPHYTTVEKAKTIWSKLRVKKLEKETRVTCCHTFCTI
jgi:hypothetical protein